MRCVLPRRVWRVALVAGALLAGPPAPADAQSTDPAGDGPRKQASAIRVANGAVRVDGRLDDAAWRDAPAIEDFIQKEPVEHAPPFARMRVQFVYDDGALYVGARMWSAPGERPQAPMGRRDSADQAEHILVALDTFLDRRTAYGFGVTASGVRLERYYPRDDETSADAGFDPVWEAKTSVDEEGWSAELWIPFSQLRFTDRAEHVWGLNVLRITPARNEDDYWVLTPRTGQGWSSRFGELRGISGVRPTRRIELLPYVAGTSVVNGDRDRANPFDDGRNLGGGAGADLKMGLGPNLTLEATFNPDFGQVEADPAEVNLTNFETFFAEKRPFFLEGSQVLNVASVPNFFYSRRIGARPSTPVAGTYVDYPRASTIVGAAKLTGRLSRATSIGVLTAVTDDERALRVADLGGPVAGIPVAPQATYLVTRIQQQFGRSGSTAGLMVTGVHRDLTPGDPLADLFTRNAVVAAGDATLRFNGGEYELSMWTGASRITGERGAIARLQQSSVHYFQRPDQDYVTFDPTRTTLGGQKFGAKLERRSGVHWLWSVQSDNESPSFESNDVGRLSNADGLLATWNVRYRETRPGPVFRAYTLGVSQRNQWNFGGVRQAGTVQPSATLSFRNFWTATLSTTYSLPREDMALTRGGPSMGVPQGWTASASLSGNPGRQTTWSGGVSGGRNALDGSTVSANASVSVRPGPRWQFSLKPFYSHEINAQQYVTTIAGGRAESYNRRYVFAFIDRHTYSTEARLSFTVRPDVTVDLYAEPFAASGHYDRYGELLRPGARERLEYGTGGTTALVAGDGSRTVTDGGSTFALRNNDFTVQSFRSNLVLKWEWRPGSTLYLVWQQDRSASEALGQPVGVGDLWDSLHAPGSNAFVAKTSFWLPVR